MKILIIVIACSLLAIACNAQDSVKVLDALYHDFSIPDASAFSLLGVSPDKVTRPTSAKEVSAGILNIAQKGSTITPGVAVEWAPFITFDNRFVKKDSSGLIYKNFEHYRKTRIARNFLISLASLQDSVSSKAAIGLSVLLYDGSDPSRNRAYCSNLLSLLQSTLDDNARLPFSRTDFINNVKLPTLRYLNIGPDKAPDFWVQHLDFKGDTSEAGINNIKQAIVAKMGRSLADSEEHVVDMMIADYTGAVKAINGKIVSDKLSIQKAIAKAKDDFKRMNWNATAIKIGAGNIWNSSNFKWSGLTAQKFSGYISLATRYPDRGSWLYKHAQLVGLLQYTKDYRDSSTDKNQFSCGGRILVGSNKVHGSFEVVYSHDKYKSISNDIAKPATENYRSTVGVEFRMNDGLWLELATGINGPPQDFWKQAGMLTFGSVKYTFKKESRYSIPN